MLSFEEWKKQRNQNGAAAPGNAPEENTKTQSGGGAGVLSFEDWKKQRNQNGGTATGNVSAQDTKAQGGGIPGVMTFAEWREHRKQLDGQTGQPTAAVNPTENANAQAAARAREVVQEYQRKSQEDRKRQVENLRNGKQPGVPEQATEPQEVPAAEQSTYTEGTGNGSFLPAPEDYDDNTRQMFGQLTDMNSTLVQQAEELTQTESALKTAADGITQYEQQMEQIKTAYEMNPTNELYLQYEQLYAQYREEVEKYNQIYGQYKKLYDQYAPMYADYEKQMQEYEAYVGGIKLYGDQENWGVEEYTYLADRAQKEYDAYVQSPEYQAFRSQNLAAREAQIQVSGNDALAAENRTEAQEETKEAELRMVRDYWQTMAQNAADQKTMEEGLAELERWAPADRAKMASFLESRTSSYNNISAQWNAITAKQELEEKYGAETVDRLYKALSRKKNQEKAEDATRKGQAAADKYGALASLVTIPVNLYGSIISPIGYLAELADGLGDYKTLDPNNMGMLPSKYAAAVRERRAETIAGDIFDEDGNQISDGGALRQTASYAYQGLMSSADSLARALVGGGSKAVSLGIAAMGSYGQTVSDASARGATPAQAMMLGVANGGLETATEYLPLDELMKVAKGGAVPAKQLLKNIFKQAAIEVTEEEVSFLGSLLAEAVILQEKSGYNQQIAEAVANGASYEEAVEQANWKTVWEAAETAITSAFSGSSSGLVSSAAANINDLLNEKSVENLPYHPDARVELADMQVQYDQETWDVCDRLAKLTGRNIKLYQHYGPGSSAENGYYENGVIYVNTRSGDPIAQVISHELTHSVEFANEYKELSKLVLGRIEAMGGDLKQLRQQKADLYAQEGHPLETQEAIDQEIVAEYVAKNLLTNEQQIMEAARQNRPLIEKIKGWIDKILGAMGNKDAAERAYLTQVQSLYAKALQQPRNVIGGKQTVTESGKNVSEMPFGDIAQSDETTGAMTEDDAEVNWDDPMQVRTWAQNLLQSGQITDEEFNGLIDLADSLEVERLGRESFNEGSGKKFSINPDFEMDIDRWAKSGMPQTEQFILGSTGDVLQGLGAIESDIYFNGDKISKILNDHPEMTLDIIKKIPQIVDDPVLVLKSRNTRSVPRNTRLVMFGSVKADNGQPVLCVLDLRPVENRLVIDDMQKVTSAYTKDDPTSFVQNSEVLYADKKRTAKLLRSIGLHWPIELQQSGYIGSISYSKRNVNIEGKPFSEIIKDVSDGAMPFGDTMQGVEVADVPDEAAAEVNWEDPMQVRTWAQNLLQSGQITDEEFNGLIDLADSLEVERLGRESFENGNNRKFSISNISGEKADYGVGVILDTDIFDGVRPSAWGTVLSDYVYNNLAGKEMTVYDENGKPESIYLAKENDRVRKDGAKNSHRVLDKLAGFRGDQVRAQAIVHLSEVLQASRYENTTDEHSHQWMDENGWIFRKAYLQTKDGKIYEATLNIADGRDRKTLYEVNRVHQIDKKETSASIPSTDNNQRSRYQEPGMGGTQSEVTGQMITEEGKAVKRQYSFAGPSAKTANSQTLAEAKALDDAGAANETIRQQTGWFKGMDGKWRFEVDDSSSRISENVSNYMTLGELLQDAEILEAYPNMADVSIVFQSLPKGVNASYSPQFDTIDVSNTLKGDPEAIRAAVLHEVQHVIQRWEGFTKGTTVESWDRKIKAGFDSRRGEDVRKAQETEREIRRVQQEDPEFYHDMMELDAMTPDGPRGEVNWDTLEQITEDSPEWQAFDARRDELQETYGETKVWDFMDLLYQQEKAAQSEGRTATELYWDTAGEIEARNTAGRRNLTAEERKNTPPMLGDEDTVFAESSLKSDQAIGKTTDNKPFVTIDTDILAGVPRQDWVKTVTNNLKQKFPMGITVGKNSILVDRQSRQEMTFSKYTRWLMGTNPSLYEDKLRATNNIDEIIKAATDWVNEGLNHQRKDNITSFARGNVLLSIGGKQYSAEVVVGTRSNGTMVVYDLLKISPTQFTEKETSIAITENPSPEADRNTMLISAMSVSQELGGVNRKYSINGQSVSRKNVAEDLRDILSRGGDVAELRRYIRNLEQEGGNPEQTSRNLHQAGMNAEQSEAHRIVNMAKRYGLSVEEYLRRNWEQYDVDGRWNEPARKALELERGGRKYSVSETQEQTEQKTAEQIRLEMPAKARNVLQGAQSRLVRTLQDKMGVNKFTNLQDLKGIAEEIADAYLTEGTVAPEKMDQLFELAYAGGIVRDDAFYQQYKEIKTHLRNNPVTISEGDSHDIADFADFKRRNFGTLRIVNEGGMPVDSAYHELNTMAPELFPESITHPADQLVRMAEVARNIQVSEYNLDAYYGSDRENFRKYARHEFENAVADVVGDLRQVKRYMDGSTEQEESVPTTSEEAMEYYKQLKDARRTYEKAQAKNLLTPHDEMQVGKLLRGEILPEDLDPDKDYVKGIMAIYEAKKDYERLSKQIAQYKRTVRSGYRDTADRLLETANAWKDKKVGIAYSRETMERNIDDIVPDKEVAKAIKQEYFESVHIKEAESTRFKTQFRDRVRGMNLSTKIEKGNLVSEAHAVQLLGEAEDNIRVLQEARGRMKARDGKTIEEWRAVVQDLWKESPNLNQEKIRGAVKEFRQIYDELFQLMNAERVRNGYEPVNYRKGYFPHFQPGEGDGILGAFGKALNIDTSVAALPTTINGLTHTFKPGIQWFGNAQERLGFNTAYDAVEGFDKYIEGVSSVIHQTENIQKLRALASQIRYRTSDEGIRNQVDAVMTRENLSDEEKTVQINDIYEHGRYTLSNFVNELDEYTNLLANKKSKLDRTMEAMMGRKAYAVMKAWEARVGANMIAGNLSSAFTNFIPLTQAGAQLDRGSLLKGMAATLKSYKEDDGIVGMSSFLTNRRGSDPLVQTWSQKASGVLGKPMELIDGFTSESIVRAAYFQNLKRGMSEAEALHQADVFASYVMADRSKGSMPTIFESRNPVFKAFTQFQLEVNNQFSEVFKDLPRGHREKGIAALGMVLLKYFLGAFLYNEVYEYFVGRRAALDPFGILNDTVGDLTGYELPNLVEWGTNAIRGKETTFETERVGIGEAGKNLASNLLGELPFSSGLTLLGIETDGGRIPASSAVPDLTALWDAATMEGWSAEKRWKEAQDELNKLAYVIPPFGGNQIGKLWKGIKAYSQGGSYNVDSEGNDILQYPVFKDSPADAVGNAVRMGIFGKNALPEAQDWVNSGFNSLSAKQTAVYQDMLDAGENDRKAFVLVQQIGSAKTPAKFWILGEADVANESKAIVYYGMLASKSEQELMDKLADAGAEQGAIGNLMMDLKKAGCLKGAAMREAQQKALSDAAMTDEEKIVVVGYILGTEMVTDKGKPTPYANFLSALDRGLSVDEYMEMRTDGVDVEEYLELTDSGIASGKATELAYDMYDLDGREDVDDAEYWRLIVNSSDNENTQMAMLGTRMSDSYFEKLTTAQKLDVSPNMFVSYYETRAKYDADGNGSYTQAEIKAVIDAMGKNYTNEQKGVLWQMATGSKSTKNNPYSKEAGQKWLDIKNAAKENT